MGRIGAWGESGRLCDLLCEKFYLTHLACSYEKYLIVNVQLMSWIFRLSRKKNQFRVQKPHFRQCVVQRYRRNWCVKKRRSGTFDLQPKPLSISRFLFHKIVTNDLTNNHIHLFFYISYTIKKYWSVNPLGRIRALWAGCHGAYRIRGATFINTTARPTRSLFAKYLSCQPFEYNIYICNTTVKENYSHI